jgi:hypothetical protein
MKKFTYTLLIAAYSCSLAFAEKPNNSDKILPLEKTAIHFSQPLYPDEPLTLGDNGLMTQSKSYYQEVSGAELKQGISLHTTGHSAVVRVTPMVSNALGKTSVAPTLEPDDLELGSAAGEFNISKSGMSLAASSDQLHDAHPQLFKNTAAFVLDETVGSGELKLKTRKSIADDDRYLIHVFDKNSEYSLNLSSKQSSFGNIDTLAVDINLMHQQSQKSLSFDKNSIKATLISPDGNRYPMSIAANKHGTRAMLDLNFDLDRRPGELWKVVVDTVAENNTNLKRTGELAVDIHSKTAQIIQYAQKGSSLLVSLAVDQPGRYEIRAWVFQNNGKRSEPASLEYFAQWLEPGTHTLNIPLKANKKASHVAQLQLLDQTRLAMLQLINQQ